MKAFTVFQPWASLIMIGAKPLEFRKWDYTEYAQYKHLEGKRIVVHAAARPIRPAEVADLIERLEAKESSSVSVAALPLLYRLRDAHKCQGVLNLSAALGTVTLGKPRRVDALFKLPDSDRVEHHMFGWPMTDPKPFAAPVPVRGQQGFWNCDVRGAS